LAHRCELLADTSVGGIIALGLAGSRVESLPFAEIAQREGQVERHIRLLAPLAFASPRILAAIVDGTAPADLTVTGLAKAPVQGAEYWRSGVVAVSLPAANDFRIPLLRHDRT
jgi:hypothetical protein